MDPSPPKPRAARFGLFEADFGQRILTKGGLRIKLQDQPFQVLTMLLERPGELVSREEIRRRLWSGDTFVEFDDGLNTAIKKLRAALNDSADNPRLIETVPRRGYRFLAPVTIQGPVHQTQVAETGQSSAAESETPASSQDVAAYASSSGISSNPSRRARVWARSRTILAVVFLALCGAVLFSFLFKPQVFSWRPMATQKATLIVIPLDNLSGDPQQEYFSEGFTEEISTQLALVAPDRLGVIGRLTAERYKHSGKDIAQIAREIPIQYVLEGSVRRDRERLRVTVQLIEAAHQTHVWAAEYDRDLGDTLGLQQEIAVAVARQIKVKLTPERERDLTVGSAASAEAHDAYLKGLYEWNKRTEDGFHGAIMYFERAIQIQPDYAPAYAGLSNSYNLLGQYGFARQAEAYPKAKVYAQKALRLDGTLAEAYTALADVEIKYDRDWGGGERDFVRAIQLNPNYATAHLWYAEDYLTFAGRLDEAIAEAKKAREIEPLAPIVGTIVAETYFVARDYDQAIHEAKNVLDMEPTFLPALGPMAWSYEQKGMFPEAIAAFQKGVEISHGSIAYGMKVNLAHAYALSGNKLEARKILSESLADSRKQYFPPCSIAIIYTALGEKDSALDWLERCGQVENLPNLRVDPRFDSLRQERRFQELVRKAGPN